jgi:hypothetical protein
VKGGHALLVGKPGSNTSSGRANSVAQSKRRAELTTFDCVGLAEGCTDNGMDGWGMIYTLYF